MRRRAVRSRGRAALAALTVSVRVATVLALAACSRSAGPGGADASTDGASGTNAVPSDHAIALAEDLRRAKDVPPEVRTSHDAATRRRSARALARIADADSADGLAAHLADDDPETVAWAAYGLGYACKGREDAHVRMLAARGANLPSAAHRTTAQETTEKAAGGARTELDPRVAVARAIGRCAGALSEPVLVSLLGARGAWTEPALLGLGDLATRKKQLGADAMTALLEAAAEPSAPQDLAFYALGRAEPGETFARRVVEAARGALARPGPARLLAIHALGRAGKDDAKSVAPELARVVTNAKGFETGERAEAARLLGDLGDPGQQAIGGAIAALTPDAKDPIAIAALAGAGYHVLSTLLAGLAPEAPKKAEPALAILASLAPPTQPKPGFARRLAELRCSAALALARGAYDADVLQKCDEESSEASQRARLKSLLRTKGEHLRGARLAVLRALAKSEHLRVREEVIESLGSHDVGEAAVPLIADALGSRHAGLVATAAELLNAHPDRALVLAESERRAALDPRAPPPTTHPAQDIAVPVAKALADAIAEPWPEDRFETRIALVEAAASLHHPQAKDAATAACKDPNPVVRERASKALRTLGVAPAQATCGASPERERAPKPAPELDAPLARPARVVFKTDALELAVVLEPELSPVTATRLASLVKAGFFKGLVVHRVVPGFVAQLGDPEGDGYGGSGTPLRCETSPVPFDALDVGMALAGRDTGSSQFFVTLARTPHLDGEYTRVGHAEGDWASVAQGDVIEDARLVE